MYFYRAFGLSVQSDLPITELEAIAPTHTIDVQIQSGKIPNTMLENRDQLLIHIPQIASLLIEKGTTITYTIKQDIEEDIFRLFLLGSAMGALLQQRGYIVLHGNTISNDGLSCRVFVGNQGAGKSTTSAWHYQQGATLVADDISAVYFDAASIPYVIPSYPQLKLWKTSLDLLGINTKGLRKLRPLYDKYALPIHQRFATQPLPLTQLIELSETSNTSPSIMQKLGILTKHSYRYLFIHRMQRSNDYARSLLRLAQKVQILTLARPTL